MPEQALHIGTSSCSFRSLLLWRKNLPPSVSFLQATTDVEVGIDVGTPLGLGVADGLLGGGGKGRIGDGGGGGGKGRIGDGGLGMGQLHARSH